MKAFTWLFLIFWVAGYGSAIATPFIPEDDAQVLERLPYRAASSKLRELREWRTALNANADDLQLAVRLAWRYVEMGRTAADPRYYGYAQAALAPWWDNPQPPPAVRLLRATLRQNRHDFQGALKDLERLLQSQPRNAQAWLTQAVILGVQGDYAHALRSCLPLFRLADELLAKSCTGSILAVTGQAEASYRMLQKTLVNHSAADPRDQLWTLTILAETAARLGHTKAAETYFQQALDLELRDIYLLSSYADFLLDQDRPADVRTLLAEDIRPDPLLLRLALAEQQLNSPRAKAYRETLAARLQAYRRRGETSHLGSEARFALHLAKQPDQALRLALHNWTLQREPRDAQLVLEAALAANDPASAQPVLTWLQQTGLEDVQLTALARQLMEQPS